MKGLNLMTIEQLDKSRILISLKNADMDAYSISIDKLNIKDKACKETLKSILKTALDKVGISTVDKAVLVEAMPHREGMLILVTVDFMHSIRKVYRVKKPKMLPCCRFDSAEGLLSCMELLKHEKIRLFPNSLWQYQKAFYLIFDYAGIPPRAKAILSEYSKCHCVSLTRLARIKEAGKELLSYNAVKKIAEMI
ncbi:MAG: adaptor protein MecA [Ruminococcus sp.]|nr:adaptor protein MecA [Ruminococcus sp.]